jgi:hypothetical protein
MGMENKVVIIINDEFVRGWVPFNMIAHLCLSLGKRLPDDWYGKHPLFTKDKMSFAGLIKYPVIIKQAKLFQIMEMIKDAISDNKIYFVCFSKEMLETGPDVELVQAMENIDSEELIYMAVIFSGTKARINQLTKKAKLLNF